MPVAGLGLLAGLLTTLAWLPQLLHTWRRRSAADIAWPYLMTTGTGISAWLLYGVLDGDVALVAANAVTLMLVLALVALKALGARQVPASRSAFVPE